MNRSCSSVPQRTSGSCKASSRTGRSARASGAAGPGSSGRAAASRTPAARPGPAGRVRLSGEYSLSMQNSARCVLPVHVDQQVAEARGRPARAGTGRRRPRDRSGGRRSPARRAVVARLVDARRLAGRADEQPGEEVGQRRVVVPVGDQAAQQVGPAQERAVGRASAPPRTTWLPPPVPVCRPSSMNFSVPSRACRASS